MDSKKIYNDCSDSIDEESGICWSNLIPARMVLYILTWTGFLISFMMRNDINLALTAMVKHHPVNVTQHITTKESCNYQADTNTTVTTSTGYTGTFDWSSTTQSYILAAFYWTYVPSQIVGGIVTQKFGSKIAFGCAQLFHALGSLSMSWAADTHYSLVILVRLFQGFASGLSWPAMYAVVVPWIPTQERSTFMSSFQGSSIGMGLSYPVCGFLIAYFGWRSVFYTNGTLGILWCIFWYFLAFDTPESHPRISKWEKEYILENREPTLAHDKKLNIPWKSIATSKPVWCISISNFGRIWVQAVFLTVGPLYMKNILQFSVAKNGLINGAPFMFSYLSSVMFCYMADQLVAKKYISFLNCRRIFSALSQVGPGVLIIAITYIGCNIPLILVLWYAAVMFITASYAGAMANVVDVAPNFAGPVLAFTQTIFMSASFICPVVSFGLLEGQEYLPTAWRKVFYLTAFMAISTYGIYHIWSTVTPQEWNNQSTDKDKAEQAAEDTKFLEKKKSLDSLCYNYE